MLNIYMKHQREEFLSFGSIFKNDISMVNAVLYSHISGIEQHNTMRRGNTSGINTTFTRTYYTQKGRVVHLLEAF